jgi:hypothetical protein
VRVEKGGWRFFDDLLVAPLDGAFPLAEMDDVAVGVRQHLDLDVSRLLYELLDEHPVVAERGARLGTGQPEALACFASSKATRIPLPPPPAEALIITG